MPLTEHPSDQPVKIQSLMPDHLIINQKRYDHSLMITADFQILPWEARMVGDITRASLEPLLQAGPELVIIGTGQEPNFLSPDLMSVFYERGIGVEVMTTAAAVRTYTILTSEDRKVGLALII